MSNKKQSSIDWLETKINAMIENGGDADLLAVIKHIQQAKAMHKEEILSFNKLLDKHEIDALTNNTILLTAEEFYNEMFGGNNE